MSCCSLIHGKLEAYIGVRVAADVFHDIFSCRPHHVPNMTPSKVKSCDIHEGEFGKAGTVVVWNYIHDGEAKVAKEMIEDIDDVNLSTTYKVIEGDIMKDYKNFKVVVKATPQKKTEGEDWCLVHSVFDYEKLKEETPEPFSLLEFAVHMSKDIDDHHTKKE
ncbi:MLP-like protein 31 [Linum grandiflorum]